MNYIIRFISLCIIIFSILVSISSAQSTSKKEYASLHFSQKATIEDTLQQFAAHANNLWYQKESDLNFADNFISTVSRTSSELYYRPSSIYYFWSLKNADFETQKKAIEREVDRLLPLVPDSTQKKWRQYLEQNNPQLLNEMVGFWEIQDPYSSTALNERLIEHWQRIEYAKAHFNKNNNSVYGTDERGVYYVRMGKPDKIIQKKIYLNGVVDPVDFEYLSFELGNVIQTEVEIWKYKTKDDSYLYMFGKKNGSGEFGLRKDVMELVDSRGLRVQLRGGNFISSFKLRRFSERVAQVGLYNILAPYDPFFNDMYQKLESSLNSANLSSSLIERYLQSSFTVDAFVRQKYYVQKETEPRSKTSLKYQNESLETYTQAFRSLNSQNKNEYLFSIQPIPNKKIESYDSYFLSNKLFIYDNEWNLLSNIDDLKKINMDSIKRPSIYQISDSTLKNHIYYSSELIDTTRNNITIPGKINSKTTAIVASTGKEKLNFPKPLDTNQPLLISDIILGDQQKENFDARIPISPSLDYTFKKGADIMIYFEAYNIPKEGYTFTYFFKKDRWLLSHKKIEGTQVTVIADKTKKRDKQLFSINLKDLEPSSYQLVLQFAPINSLTGIKTEQRIINIEIVE